jgi:hypothetical protein
VTFVLAGTGSAEDNGKHHNHLHEVNGRLNNQNRRINKGMKQGQLSGTEAEQLHSEDQSIHNQEMQDAVANNGHLTKSEQHQFTRKRTG